MRMRMRDDKTKRAEQGNAVALSGGYIRNISQGRHMLSIGVII